MSRRIRVAELIGSRVEDASGRLLGHVVELEVGPDYEVSALLWGPRAWLRRLHLLPPRPRRGEVDRAPWDRVEQVGRGTIRLKS